MTEKEAIDTVKEFMDTFEASTDPKLWETLIIEETKELEEAFLHMMKELADVNYVVAGYINTISEDYEPVDKDAIFEAMDKLSIIGHLLSSIPPALRHEAFRRVHESNMSKLGEDGKPIRRSDGKILKGPNYKPADMTGLI